MSKFRDTPPPPHLDWPEPFVIEIVRERYQDIADYEARTALARLHAAALRELCIGRSRQATSLRLELIAACAARGIKAERLARIDLTVLTELTRLAVARFRTSARLREDLCDRFAAALDQLSADHAAPSRPRTLLASPRALRPAAAIG